MRHTSLVGLRALLLASACLATTTTAFAIVEKPFVKPVIKAIANTAKVDVEAAKIVYDPKTSIATATGTVVLVYGPYRLTATRVTYNQKTNVFTANGSVTLREPNGNRAEATTLSLDTSFREGFAHHIRALLTNDASISARYAQRKDGNLTIFEDSSYTACKDCKTRFGQPLWELVADQTVHDQTEHTLTHKNPRLKVGGVTVAAFPYLVLPDPSVKRRTGFLAPNYKYTEYMGFGAVTPYFWAIAPNYDLTFSPVWTLNQGPVADVEWRHRLKSGSYNIRGYGVHQFDRQLGLGDDEKWRGAIKTKGNFKINNDWDWGWNGIYASDRTFLQRYGFNSGAYGTNELFVTGLWDQTYVNASALTFVSLSSSVDPNEMPYAMPYFDAEHTFETPIFGGHFSFDANGYSLHRDDPTNPFPDVRHGTQQSRFVSNIKWEDETIFSGGQVVSAFAKLRSDVFISENLQDDATPGFDSDTETVMRVLPSVGLDMRWPMVSDATFGQHVITPVMQVIAAADEAKADKLGNEDAISLNFDHTSLFLDDRFTGLDRYEGGVRANLGVTYNLERDNGGFINASIGESFHLAGENSFIEGSGLEGSQSDIVAALHVSPWNGLSLGYEGRIEEDLSQFNRQVATVGLSFDRFSTHAGYQYIEEEPAYGRTKTEEFVAADARVGLTEGWYVFGDMTYDLQDDYFRSRGLGLEFDCQCLNAKLTYDQLKSSQAAIIDHRLMFSVNFATLGGTKVAADF